MRDFVGYGANPPAVVWPYGKRLPLVFVVNVEEGAEPSIPDGDGYSEALLTEAGQSPAPRGTRDLAAESLFEFGARVGFWRLMRLFDARNLKVTVAACVQALERNPDIAAYLKASRHEVICHGLKWINHFDLPRSKEEAIIRDAVVRFKEVMGYPPAGWMCRYGPSENTRAILAEVGGFLYDSDSYADELPYRVNVNGAPRLVIPHTFANNDNKFSKGWMGAADEFESWCRDALHQHRAEAGIRPSIMTVSLHCRVTGQAARAGAFSRFLDDVVAAPDVWNATRAEIAGVWNAQVPVDR